MPHPTIVTNVFVISFIFHLNGIRYHLVDFSVTDISTMNVQLKEFLEAAATEEALKKD